MRIIHFISFKESVSKIMLETNTLMVDELYVYELVKFFHDLSSRSTQKVFLIIYFHLKKQEFIQPEDQLKTI